METNMKKCPACAEEIKKEAKKCRYCGEDFNQEKKITTEEEVIYSWKANWSNYIVPIILILTITLSPIWIYYIFYHLKKKIILTNKKFAYTYWLLNIKQLNIKLEKIESIEVQKNIIDMMFWSWTIIISWTWWNNEPIRWIDNPDAFKKAVEIAISN